MRFEVGEKLKVRQVLQTRSIVSFGVFRAWDVVELGDGAMESLVQALDP